MKLPYTLVNPPDDVVTFSLPLTANLGTTYWLWTAPQQKKLSGVKQRDVIICMKVVKDTPETLLWYLVVQSMKGWSFSTWAKVSKNKTPLFVRISLTTPHRPMSIELHS